MFEQKRIRTPPSVNWRNEALGSWTEYDIARHFDSDVISVTQKPHRRTAVALLQSSGAEMWATKNMLFWRDYWNQRLERDELAKCTCGLDSFAAHQFRANGCRL